MEKRLVVISYPKLSQGYYDWIQRIRAAHDMHYGLVEPHVTLVFPSRMDGPALVGHTRHIASNVKKFGMTLRCAVTVKGILGGYSHVLLVPDRGFSDIVRLHDRLYTGPLAPELRLDIPFYPHITVGNSADVYACKRLTDELNGTDFQIEGTIDAMDIAELVSERASAAAGDEEDAARAVNTIERVVLG